ncbi:hypothetical protein PHPALM_30806 [Phytophthora palmivora]|uniref:Uncharacterized protein n=1 Tax=Phytophthora palmivora TaxID=4796 RepID=A0A2P4X468_9STRA|nr:hypothetical protein PHPALM_30806 [Phytophthora palmivora]
MLSGTAITTTVVLLFLVARTNAHGYLKQPEPSWVDDPNSEYVVLIDNYWDIGSGGDQCGLFKTMAAEKGMSVRDVVLDMVKDKKCGNTLADVDPKPVPADGKAIWVGGEGGGGFTHRGPCELYIDDKMVLHSDDCSEDYPTDGGAKMSEMPVDFSSCNGKCIFTIYWLGFQNEQWQAYINCVPLSGSGSSTPTTNSSDEKTPTAGSSTEEQKDEKQEEKEDEQSPANENPPTEGSTASTAESETPETMNQAEAPSTETELSSPSKCTPSRRLSKKTLRNDS